MRTDCIGSGGREGESPEPYREGARAAVLGPPSSLALPSC